VDDSPAPFAKLVRERMESRGLGLRELCRGAGLDPSFFSKVLAGKRNPPSEELVLRRIAERLELDAPRLIVAAGRIPYEWRRVWTDESLFDSVHALASGRTPAPRARKPEPEPEPQPPYRFIPKDFGEELL